MSQLPRVPGGFGCIVADPPWSFRDKGSRVAPDAHVYRPRRGEGPIYKTQPIEWITALPVADVAARSAHLYLWVPSALLAEGLKVVRAWGFDFKTTLVWDKTTKHGRAAFGAGHYFRGAHELLLFGVRGRCPARVRNERSRFEGVAGAHSVKPPRLQEIAERVSPGPYLELFARRARTGWALWGDEAPASKEAA